MASVRGILNIQSLNELTYEKHSVLRGACPAAGAGRHVREVAHAVLYRALPPVSDSGMHNAGPVVRARKGRGNKR